MDQENMNEMSIQYFFIIKFQSNNTSLLSYSLCIYQTRAEWNLEANRSTCIATNSKSIF